MTGQKPATADAEGGSLKDLILVLWQNRFGMIGFGLSLLQLAVHASWLIFAMQLQSSGQAKDLTSDSWQMWVISVLVIIGAVLTAISLFLCLYGMIHGKPKVLAIIGFCISFFVGAVTTFTLILSAMGPVAG